MKRLAVMFGLLLVGALSLFAAQQPPASLEIQQVKDNLYMIKGGGGNTAVLVTDEGVVLVDTKLSGNGPGILEKVKSVTPKPVTMIINTHTHGDHVGSNSAFGDAVTVVAHENCKASMEKMPMFQPAEAKKFLPGTTYKDKLSLKKGKDRIDLYHFGPGHTGGDTFIVFPGLKVMHSGDIFAGKNTPLIDTNNGGSALGYPVTLKKAAAGIRGVETIIPGHSALLTWADFKEYGEFMQDLVTTAEQAKKAGKTAEQAADESKLSEKYKGYGMGQLKTDIAKVYNEIK